MDNFIEGIPRTRPDGTVERRWIDVTTMNDGIDPGVRWAVKNPEEAERYVRKLHPVRYFWRDLWDYLKAEWAKPLWGGKHEGPVQQRR